MSFGRKMALWVIFVVMIPVSACSTGATSNGSAQDTVAIDLVTTPNPPRVGDGKLVIHIADAMGQPIDNLKIDVSVDMTSMSMGAQVGLAEAQAKGIYSFPVTFHRQGEYIVQLWVRRNGSLLKNEEVKVQVDK